MFLAIGQGFSSQYNNIISTTHISKAFATASQHRPCILWPYPVWFRNRESSMICIQISFHSWIYTCHGSEDTSCIDYPLRCRDDEANRSESCGWTTIQKHPRNSGFKSKSVTDMIGIIKVIMEKSFMAAKFGELPWIIYRKLDRCPRRHFLQGCRWGSICWSFYN